MNDYFTFFYVKHFELPLCMKCAIQINLPCLAYRRCDTQSDNVTGLCHRFGMCHGVCASDVTGLACVMASVRQMSQVWHVPMASIDMSQVFVTHATMLRDTSGFQWHMPKTCDINL